LIPYQYNPNPFGADDTAPATPVPFSLNLSPFTFFSILIGSFIIITGSKWWYEDKKFERLQAESKIKNSAAMKYVKEIGVPDQIKTLAKQYSDLSKSTQKLLLIRTYDEKTPKNLARLARERKFKNWTKIEKIKKSLTNFVENYSKFKDSGFTTEDLIFAIKQVWG
jgi:hypothetical protein